MLVSLGSGIAQTLRQQLLQQQINAQYFQNANSFLDLGTRLDFLTQFADARNQGLSPTQALLGIQQNAVNPLTSNLGLQNFSAQSSTLAPFAVGAAAQGSPALLNQLNASIGAPQLTSALPQQNILSAVSPFAGLAGTSALNAQFQQDRFIGENSRAISSLAGIGERARRRNRRLSDLTRLADFNLVTPVVPDTLSINASSTSGASGFTPLYGGFIF